MPCATARGEDTSLIQLGDDRTHASEPLGPQVIHDVCQGVSDRVGPSLNLEFSVLRSPGQIICVYDLLPVSWAALLIASEARTCREAVPAEVRSAP